METVVPILVFPTEEVNSTTPSIKDIFSQKKNKNKKQQQQIKAVGKSHSNFSCRRIGAK